MGSLIHPCAFGPVQMLLLEIKQAFGKKAGRFAREGTLVAPGFSYAYASVDESARVVNCAKIKDMLTIHCSHASTDYAYKHGRFPITGLGSLNDVLERRSEAALMFMDDFNDQCKDDFIVVK